MKTALKFATVYVVAAFVWSLVEYFSGLQSTRIALHPYFVTPFYLLLTAAVYYFAVRERRAAESGTLRFGKMFVFGLILTGLILALNLVQFYVFNKFINPEFYPAMARHAIETANIPVAEANEYYSFHKLLIQGSIYRAVMGILATVIIGLTTKKR